LSARSDACCDGIHDLYLVRCVSDFDNAAGLFA
jgi:hypothetical protein